MGVVKSYPVEDIIKRGAIGAGDVQGLRFAYYDDGLIDDSEAAKLLALNRACAIQDPAWQQFFIESISDYIVDQARPEGYVTTANAAWLASEIAPDGQIRLRSELELLVNVLDRARWVPQSLIVIALEQIRRAVATGIGPTREATGGQGCISDAEIEMLRRIVYAYGGDGNIAITRAEADVLFRINDSLSADGHSPQWTDFFVKAIVNLVMSASGYSTPSREAALALDESLARPNSQTSPAAVLISSLRSGLGGLTEAYHMQSAEERALQRLERQRIEIITAEEITGDELAWLVERITALSTVDRSERALIEALRREAGRIAPALADILARAAH